jgi:hypothetical protein
MSIAPTMTAMANDNDEANYEEYNGNNVALQVTLL